MYIAIHNIFNPTSRIFCYQAYFWKICYIIMQIKKELIAWLNFIIFYYILYILNLNLKWNKKIKKIILIW